MTWSKKYDMPFIEDTCVFKAVMFARHMIRENDKPAGAAILIAARYYEVDQGEVAHYVGIAASSVKKRHAKKGEKNTDESDLKNNASLRTLVGGEQDVNIDWVCLEADEDITL